jgi:hypothetical protein
MRSGRTQLLTTTSPQWTRARVSLDWGATWMRCSCWRLWLGKCGVAPAGTLLCLFIDVLTCIVICTYWSGLCSRLGGSEFWSHSRPRCAMMPAGAVLPPLKPQPTVTPRNTLQIHALQQRSYISPLPDSGPHQASLQQIPALRVTTQHGDFCINSRRSRIEGAFLQVLPTRSHRYVPAYSHLLMS